MVESEPLRRSGEQKVLDAVRSASKPLLGSSGDYDTLLKTIGDARFVLIGEASHGTQEFYNERARITRRLIEEKGFHAVAVEADWPDAYRVNRYLRGHGDGDTPLEALGNFTRFPLWMWRNEVVLDFIADLAEFNATVPEQRRAGFYGLDLYSLYGSMAAVIEYLEDVDPEAAKRARNRYGCLEFSDPDPQRYGMEASFGIREPCEDEVVAQLVDLLKQPGQYTKREDAGQDEFFFAEQNARLVVNAEAYYRAMFQGGRTSEYNTWNMRDTHMADTLDALDQHLTRQRGEPARIVVWAHNSHLGDARATEMGEERGELNLGQLTRQRHGRESFLIGLTTYSGTVTAARNWDEPGQVRRVRPALPDSLEELLHHAAEDFWVDLRDDTPAVEALRSPRLERAIGVIYRPETERWSHYFHSRVSEQFDALLHFDETSAIIPLDRTSSWDTEDAPDTYPSGI